MNTRFVFPSTWILAPACPLLIALVVGCSRQREELPAAVHSTGAESDAVMVTVEPVTFRSVQRMVGLVGTLHGYEEVSLGAKVQGRVLKIMHDVADRVKPGEVLLEIDPTDYQLSVRQAQRELQVELARLGLGEVPAGKIDVTRIPMVVQAQLRRDNAQTRMERARKLVASKASAEEELTEKVSDFRVAQAEYDNQVLVAKAGIAAIQVKQEALSIARQQLQDTRVCAPEPSQPLPGIETGATYAITSRAVAEGSYVMPGADVFEVVIESPLKFRGRVPERKSSEVRLGQKADVYVSAYPRPFPGQITRINPAVDPQTRTFEVEVLVPNDASELKPGGFAKTAIFTSIDEASSTVPLTAPVHVAGVTKIFLVEDGHAKEVQVTLGVQGSDWVEIAKPKLPAGSMVITSGQTAVADRTAIAIRSESPAGADSEKADAVGREQRAASVPPMARKEAAP